MKPVAAFLGVLTVAVATAQMAWANTPQCRNLFHDSASYTVCEVSADADMRLFLRDGTGKVLGQFSAIEDALDGGKLVFAMNGGMYHEDRSPVGLYVENGIEERGIVASAGPGNFGLLPNGVFCIQDGRADVIETLTFVRRKPACRFATQSGPMLVIDGDLHPRFLENSSSRYVRNGVGTSPDGQRITFAISNQTVTFHAFARLFRDELGIDQALYLDGRVSRLHAPELGRSDPGFWLGPIIGVVERP